MVDFVTVLKKTIDAQTDKSPELRERVYAKARATIEQKIVTANASQVVAVRQRKILEEAIAATESSYSMNVDILVKVPRINVYSNIITNPPEPPKIAGGPPFSLSKGKLSWGNILPDKDATVSQASIYSHLKIAVDDLIHAVNKAGNAFPSLLKAIEMYSDVIARPYAELDAVGLWISGQAVLSYERAYREQNVARTLANPLEPSTAAALEQVCNLHSALAMSIRQSRELILESDQNRLDTYELQDIANSGEALLRAVAESSNLIDDKSRAFAVILQDQMHEIGWRSSKQAYTAYIILRNIFHSIVRYSVGSEPNLSTLFGLATASATIYGDTTLEFTRNAVILLKLHSQNILAFFNHSPELRAYIKWALTVADSVINKDKK